MGFLWSFHLVLDRERLQEGFIARFKFPRILKLTKKCEGINQVIIQIQLLVIPRGEWVVWFECSRHILHCPIIYAMWGR